MKIKVAFKYVLLVSLAINAGLGALYIKSWAIPRFAKQEKNALQTSTDTTIIFDEVNPTNGYKIPVTYGQLGPEMLRSGVIDFDKFSKTYEGSGQPLTDAQISILKQGSNEEITITPENSYFLLNYFWAVGLANQNSILTEGEMAKYGGIKEAGNFASTGGWSLGKREAMNYYSKQKMILLSSEQQILVEKVSSEIYRPCCNNSTAFPDCNHGMALLGLLELMASNGVGEDQMFEVAKYVNAYWFPGNYYDLALYFTNKEGKSFAQVNAQRLLSKEFSSASGSQVAKQWLVSKGIVAEPPKTSGGCGV
ncbi:MAG: hypothetical protein UX21_C0015G0007 [Microgenomates group bacterium GW2011_GWC2_45_8]|nr:MAG: hypothetical protein UX21_C0015G0007 [Microgenomates group bacterium GW2011_GWC2_45_8]KKU25827.1 MAG: hypothetical protein UX37_C0011G0013 [Microgenomates group bacterium GW2011_GWA2_46_16]